MPGDHTASGMKAMKGLPRILKVLFHQTAYTAKCYGSFPVTLVRRVLLGQKHPSISTDLIVRRFWDKWGFFSPEIRTVAANSKCRVWINMISSGEVVMSRPLLERLGVGKNPYVLSTDSYDGFDLLRGSYGPARVFFPPWDVRLAAERALRFFSPEALIFVMNVFLPVLLRQARRRGIRAALVNGQMSRNLATGVDAMQRTLAFRFYRDLDAIAVKDEADYWAFRDLGVPADRLEITGKIEGDIRYLRLTPEKRSELRQQLGLAESERVMIVGSVHPGEEKVIAEAFQAIRRQVPEIRLIMAPRWIHETQEMIDRVSQSGLKIARKTELSMGNENGKYDYDVLLLDTFGELGALYGVADVAFVGSSLIPINERGGGHNILEPLVHGVPPLFGPHMNLWQSTISELLKVWPNLQVDSPATLVERAVQVLCGQAPLAAIREVADEIMEREGGALDRTLAFLRMKVQI